MWFYRIRIWFYRIVNGLPNCIRIFFGVPCGKILGPPLAERMSWTFWPSTTPWRPCPWALGRPGTARYQRACRSGSGRRTVPSFFCHLHLGARPLGRRIPGLRREGLRLSLQAGGEMCCWTGESNDLNCTVSHLSSEQNVQSLWLYDRFLFVHCTMHAATCHWKANNQLSSMESYLSHGKVWEGLTTELMTEPGKKKRM
jgi:hypothetical protein